MWYHATCSSFLDRSISNKCSEGWRTLSEEIVINGGRTEGKSWLGIYKRKQRKWENKKTRTRSRKHARVHQKRNSLRKTRSRPRKRPRKRSRKKEKLSLFSWTLSWSRSCFLERVLFFFLSFFFSINSQPWRGRFKRKPTNNGYFFFLKIAQRANYNVYVKNGHTTYRRSNM